jgi:hypothetical protein
MQPRITGLSSSAMVRNLAVSRGYAADIRRGRVPHPRHWQTLAKLIPIRLVHQSADLSIPRCDPLDYLSSLAGTPDGDVASSLHLTLRKSAKDGARDFVEDGTWQRRSLKR